ncbi:MAG: response regulator [Bacteroidota bacterium]
MPPVDRSGATGYILYVEDNRKLSSLTAELLETSGYRVKTAATGTEALAHMDREPPALILMDLHLPGEMGGLEVYRKLQSKSSGKKIPFIVITGFAGSDSYIPAHELGAKAYFTKPFDIERLRRKIREILRR